MQVGIGEAFSLASAAAWAVGVILYRRLGKDMPPLALNFLKNSLVLAMVIVAVPLLHGWTLPSIAPAQIVLTMASGFIGIALADTLYFRALNELGAARMGVIGNLYSPFVILLSVVFLGERLSAMQCAGFALVSLGVVVIARSKASAAHVPTDAAPLTPDAPPIASASALTPTPIRPLRGVLFGVLSISLMAIAIVMVKRVLEAQPLIWVTAIRLVGAVGGLLLLALITNNLRRLRPRGLHIDWRLLLTAAFIGQFTAMICWLAGYKYTKASIAAILNETSSVFIVLLAWLWLREPLGRRGALGVALTLGGVCLMLL
jgi:drug/metabolite transporter (DMT)-like permease